MVDGGGCGGVSSRSYLILHIVYASRSAPSNCATLQRIRSCGLNFFEFLQKEKTGIKFHLRYEKRVQVWPKITRNKLHQIRYEKRVQVMVDQAGNFKILMR
jgi:hypothetical protein